MRFFVVAVLSVYALYAIDLRFFTAHHTVELKKDEPIYITITDRQERRLLAFKWTLFHNDGLVTISHLDGNPMQHILYEAYQKDTIKYTLTHRKDETSLFDPYVLITFLGYDYELQTATFDILHKDKQAQTQIDLSKEK
jgi:hypothetical protein